MKIIHGMSFYLDSFIHLLYPQNIYLFLWHFSHLIIKTGDLFNWNTWQTKNKTKGVGVLFISQFHEMHFPIRQNWLPVYLSYLIIALVQCGQLGCSNFYKFIWAYHFHNPHIVSIEMYGKKNCLCWEKSQKWYAHIIFKKLEHPNCTF